MSESRFVLVCGSAPRMGDSDERREAVRQLGLAAYDRVRALPLGVVVITGGAMGVDTAANNAAHDRGLVNVVARGPFSVLGRKAGPMRNQAMVDMLPPGSLVLAFWDGESKGTAHTIRIARARGDLTVEVIR